MHPDCPHFESPAEWLLGEQLCEAVGVVDDQPTLFRLHNEGQREALPAAMAAEDRPTAGRSNRSIRPRITRIG